MSYPASEVLDIAAALLNDRAKTLWTDEALLPYLKQAHSELETELNNNQIQTTFEVSAILTLSAGAITIGIPDNVISIFKVYERLKDSSEPFVEMTENDWLAVNSDPSPTLMYWSYIGEGLRVPAATTDREVKIEYLKGLPSIASAETLITVNGSKAYLSFETAGLAAEFAGRAPDVANALYTKATIALAKFISIKVKETQGIHYRQKPWR